VSLTERIEYPMSRCSELRWAGTPRSEVKEEVRA
jgi:hypothetical protein